MDAAALRTRVLQVEDLPREAVHVPEWDATIYVRTLTARERDAFESQQLQLSERKRDTNDNIRARLVVLASVDEQGVRVFADADADALGNKASAALDRLATVALRLNRISNSDIEELKGN